MNHRAFLVVILPLALLAAPVAAQTPRLSLEQVKEAVCEKADADGDSFRPKLCDPRCDCITTVLPNVNACTETAPGQFLIQQVVPARNALCQGACVFANEEGFYVPTGDSCFSIADCPSVGDPPQQTGCVVYDPLVPPPPILGFCVDPGITCTTSAQCPSGYTCLTAVGKCRKDSTTCVPAGGSLTTQIVCDSLPTNAITWKTLSGVDPDDSSAVVTCNSVSINSNDALECIAQVEAAIGQACIPFSP